MLKAEEVSSIDRDRRSVKARAEFPPRPYLKGEFIDCDATESGTFHAKVGVKRRDLYELIRLFIVQGATAWLVPPRYWCRVAYVCAAIGVALHPRRTARNTEIIKAILGGDEGQPSAVEIERGFFAGRLEERFQYLRSHRPGGWDPIIRIQGVEHVEAALARGRGIIFWGSNMAFNDLIAKIAFHRLGLETYHYTRPVHGLSNSRFGIRFLNPVRTIIERRYLGARVCAEEKIQEAMEVLRSAVDSGGTTSIKTGDRGRHCVVVPFLNGQIEMATGPVALAKRWGAALLPTFTLRACDGSFDVTIGAPLQSSKDDLAAYCQDIVTQYAQQLKPIFLTDPTQWRGWRLFRPKAESRDVSRHSAD
jgi:lauroyl/myristoyl acyltransferase